MSYPLKKDFIDKIRIHNPDKIQISFLDPSGNFHYGKVWDYSRFGIGILLNSNSLPKEDILPIKNFVIDAFGEKRELGSGKLAKLKRQNSDNFMTIYLDNDFLDMDMLTNTNLIYTQANQFRTIRFHIHYGSEIKPVFKEFISDFSYGFSVYKRHLDSLDEKSKYESETIKNQIFQTANQRIGQDIHDYINEKELKLISLTQKLNQEDYEKYGLYTRSSLWNYIKEASIVERCLTKPRGYAGDYVVLEMIYNKQYLGYSSFGKILHWYTLERKTTNAVNNRRNLVFEELKKLVLKNKSKRLRVLAFASGPAKEIQDFVADYTGDIEIEFVLYDQDPDSLRHAKKGIDIASKRKNFTISYINDSTRMFLKHTNPLLTSEKFDFIYSMGILDYFSHTVSKSLIAKFASMLNQNGQLLMGNFHKKDSSKVYMDYLLDWQLLYRDEAEMLELTSDLANNFRREVKLETSESQMFLSVFNQ